MRKVYARMEVHRGYDDTRRKLRWDPSQTDAPFFGDKLPLTQCGEVARRMQLRSAPSSQSSLQRIAGWSDAFAFPQKDKKSNAAQPPRPPVSPLTRRRLGAGKPVDTNAPAGFVDRKYHIQPPKSPPKPKGKAFFHSARASRAFLTKERAPRKLPNLRQPSRICSRQSARLLRNAGMLKRQQSQHGGRTGAIAAAAAVNDHPMRLVDRPQRSLVKSGDAPGARRANGATYVDFIRENADEYRHAHDPDLNQRTKIDDRRSPENARAARAHFDTQIDHAHDPNLRQAVRVDARGGHIAHSPERDFVHEKIDGRDSAQNVAAAEHVMDDKVSRALLHLCDPGDHDYVHENAHPLLLTDAENQRNELTVSVQTVHAKIDQKKKKLGLAPEKYPAHHSPTPPAARCLGTKMHHNQAPPYMRSPLNGRVRYNN